MALFPNSIEINNFVHLRGNGVSLTLEPPDRLMTPVLKANLLMDRTILLVGAGGFLGSISRFLLSTLLTQFSEYLPWGTFIANITGCLLIGLFFGLSENQNWLTPNIRIFLTTGFCGGYTTFSSFSFEIVKLIESSSFGLFLLYWSSTFLFCLIATAFGYFLSRGSV